MNQAVPSRSSVSILHLVLVLMTVSILACAAILRWFDQAEVTLNRAVDMLGRDLHYVQCRALLENRELHVIFFEDGNGYEVLHANGQPVVSPMGAESFQRRYNADAVFAGVEVQSLDLKGSHRLICTPNGFTPDTGSISLSFDGEVLTHRLLDEATIMNATPPGEDSQSQ